MCQLSEHNPFLPPLHFNRSAASDTIRVPEIRRVSEHLYSSYGPEIATQIPLSN